MDISAEVSEKTYLKFKDKFEINNDINRKTVSFQANKKEPFFNWFKYKEGFSTQLVDFFLNKYTAIEGNVIDPFVGAGTTLFTASKNNRNSTGIELLPVGNFFIEVRKLIPFIHLESFKKDFEFIKNNLTKIHSKNNYFNHIKITDRAFPDYTEKLLNNYFQLLNEIKSDANRKLLSFILFSILESISYTRKDGQYLRWDNRSGKNEKSKFNKGIILGIEEALVEKYLNILTDIEDASSLFTNKELLGEINNICGSSLDVLPTFEEESFDFMITSPPYCNRYDYTRTYALELVYLGVDDSKIKKLRQDMLSCTVENKEKIDYLNKLYSSLNKSFHFETVMSLIAESDILKETKSNLDILNKNNLLNNKNIPTMVYNYFIEMFFIVYEISRILKTDARAVIVNDNVRYGGCEIPVDLILCDFAEKVNFEVEKIYILPTGKGNSSQQMGNYGRSELRKCVYLWKKK